MAELVFTNGEKVRVENIICLARNYRKHAEELGNAVPDKIVTFAKPTSSICFDGDAVIIPEGAENVHHEVELTVIIGSGGRNISAASAPRPALTNAAARRSCNARVPSSPYSPAGRLRPIP